MWRELPYRKKIRLSNYDYSQPGYYFVTICTKNKIHYFGEIENRIMKLTKAGKIAINCWHDIPARFQNIGLDEFVIMPDHIHGIIIIENHKGRQPSKSRPTLGDVIGSYKSLVVYNYSRFIKINKLNNVNPYIWQKRFHDNIIRSKYALNKIRKYIINNPKNWNPM